MESTVYIFLTQDFADTVNAGRSDPAMASVQAVLDRNNVRLVHAKGEHDSCFVLQSSDGSILDEAPASAITAQIRSAAQDSRVYAGAVTGPRPAGM